MSAAHFEYLPSALASEQVTACLGLISDTHIPMYWPALPTTIADIFRDVDLILHAGDIGELLVLDELSCIAPVIAVHGNDDSPHVKQQLPYQQLICVAGVRIVLCHSHYPDWEMEMERRKDDSWQSILAQRAAIAQPAGASIMIYGHTHIPMVYNKDGVLLINPGAIASPKTLGRQVYPTVALLFILKDGTSCVVHVDVNVPDQPFVPQIDWDAGFAATAAQFCSSLIDPELTPTWKPVEAYLRKLMGKPPYPPVFDALHARLLKISHRCWSGEQAFITRADLLQMLDEAKSDSRVPEQVISDLLGLLQP